MVHENKKLRRWGMVMFAALSVVLLSGVWLDREQAQLADSVLRLHVLANSDSQADQQLKEKVRDRVLAEAQAILPPGAGLEQARRVLGDNLERLAAAGADVVEEEGYAYPVAASLEQTWFPTKEYEDFSLPAGEYEALRVVIGEGDGQNWWCVVFPPLCLASVSETAEQTALESGLSEQQVALMTGESEGYVVKFKAIELWEDFQRWMEGE